MLYDTLASRYNHPRLVSGNVPIQCPYCDAKTGKGYHAGFSPNGFFCWRCSTGKSLVQLARDLDIDTEGQTAVAVPIKIQRPPAPWLAYADGLQKRYTKHERRLEIIQAYKPMPRETIERFGIGVGRLPYFKGDDNSPDSEWLNPDFWGKMWQRITVPLIQNGRIVGFSGRALKNDDPIKWINPKGGGRIIWGMDYADGRPVTICENRFDAAWASGENPNRAYIATNGTAVSDKAAYECAMELKRRGTPCLTLLFDNDIVGQARGDRRKRLEREWLAERPNARLPIPCADKWAAACKSAGLKFVEYVWKQSDPDKADLGYLLMRRDK